MKTVIHKIISVILVMTMFLSIFYEAFAETLILPSSLQVIGEESFYGDESLEEVLVPVGTESIGNHAFANSGLKKIFIPDTVKNISSSAFNGLSEDFTIYAPKYSAAYDYAMENNYEWVDSQLYALNTVFEVFDDEVFESDTAELTFDEISFDLIQTDAITDQETLNLVAEYNAEQLEMKSINDSLIEIRDSFDENISGFMDYVDQNEFNYSEDGVTMKTDGVDYTISADLIGVLDSDSVFVGSAQLDDGSAVIEMQKDGVSYYIKVDENGMTNASEEEINEASFFMARSGPGLESNKFISALYAIEDTLDKISYWSEMVDKFIEEGINTLTNLADKNIDSQIKAETLSKNKIGSVASIGKEALAKHELFGKVYTAGLRGLLAIQKAWKGFNVFSSITSLTLDINRAIKLNKIADHHHPTDEDIENHKENLVQELFREWNTAYIILINRIVYGSIMAIDAISQVFNMALLVGGPAGFAFRVMSKWGIKAAKNKILLMMANMGLTYGVDKIGDNQYNKVISLDNKLHDPTPTPTVKFTPTATTAFTPTPTASPTLIASITPTLYSTPVPEEEWDPDFLEWCLFVFDSDGDGELSEEEILDVTDIDCSYTYWFTSLSGIRNFVNLETLNCGTFYLTNLNVSGLSNLKMLDCSGAHLTSLNVSGCSNLEWLDCSLNPMTSLDVSGCSNLKYLNSFNSDLTSLNVSGCSNLEILDCVRNRLTSLNVSGLPHLKTLECADNQLTSLNASGCSNLENLYCQENLLTSLNVSGCSNLKYLDLDDNQLTSLNVSGCSNLEWLWCEKNQLTGLNISGLSNLKYLDCSNNQLTGMNVSDLSNLEWLICENNQLTSLNVSGLSHLETLYCYNNRLTSLNVSECSNLNRLWCYDNQLTSLILSNLPSLSELDCLNNKLTSLDISGCDALQNIKCDNDVEIIR